MLLDALYKLILDFSLCMLITDLSKFLLGRLRLNFLTLCNPNLEDGCYHGEDKYSEGNGTDYYYYQKLFI